MVERSLRQAALWDEVKDRLDEPGTSLSGGQQQRLCIARALANQPEVLLMDEPARPWIRSRPSASRSSSSELKRDYTIVIVTHNMQQAARVSDRTGFFYLGKLVECGPTQQIFTQPGRRAHRGLHHREIRMSQSQRHFHEELSHLKQRLVALSSEAEEATGNAVEALLRRDKTLAQDVIRGDRAINTLESAIEEQAFQLIALHQPMARDLRLIFSAIKIVHDLERVGDHAVNIAQSAERLLAFPHVVPEPEIVEMARLSRQMLADALGAFVRADAPLAREVCRRDDAVDSLNDSVFRILLTHMMEDQRSIGACMELLLVSRNLERVADLATNIAEDVVFRG